MKKPNPTAPCSIYRRLLILLLCLCCSGAAAAPPFATYAERVEFLLAPPGGMGTGLHGYANPALLTYVDGSATTVAWSADGDDWGAFSAIGRLGLGQIHRQLPGKDRDEYRLGLGLGDRAFGLGLAYGRSVGKSHGVLGASLRPSPYFSLGLTLTSDFNAKAREGAVDLGLRPFGSDRLTLFADGAQANDRAGGGTYWSAGAAVAIWPGLELSARLFDNETFSLGLRLGLGRIAVDSQARYDRGADQTRDLYAVHLRPAGAAFHQRFIRPRPRFLAVDLNGPVRYQRFAFFDQGRTLVQLLDLLDDAGKDPQIAGLALNLSGMRADPAIAWEVRTKLQQLRQEGKHIVVYIDRMRLWNYYIASVADRIVLDPQGMLVLDGFVAGQTYYKGALDKLGIGFDEWRQFTYKSAFETLTRNDMSAAEREQLQTLLDDIYAQVRHGVCRARNLTPETFDRLIDEHTLFLPQDALEAGLIDAIGRWDEVKKITHQLAGAKTPLLKDSDYIRPTTTAWGAPAGIAVVYVLGICDLDSGIRARALSRLIANLKDDPAVAAVVLRVDSPGGDYLASALVAAAIRQVKERKPVIVSQGTVAASGGYWISMHADAIVATPHTVTGSIGVIGSWAYNKGLKESLQLTTDHVQTGKHADLAFGMALPLLGLRLPDRNLDADELAMQQRAIQSLYKDFVAQVAAGRDRTPAQIEAIAQGRIWSGHAAQQNGLVDRLGGLQTAIELAREKAHIPADRPIRLIEYPRRQLLDAEALTPSLIGVSSVQPELPAHLDFRLRHIGQPLLLLPLETNGFLQDHPN